jgi:hypothetical protein
MTEDTTTTAKPIQALRTTGRELLTAPALVVIAVVDMLMSFQTIEDFFGPKLFGHRSDPVRNC